jgi:adenylosuccinate synthase
MDMNFFPNEIDTVDVVVGLAWGDEGKGKVTSSLAKDASYDYVCRFNGGPNAGHTVYLNDKQYKTHLIPSGVFHGIPSIIGPGCVINPAKFMDEIQYLEKNGFDTSLVKVSPRAHVITGDHISYDRNYLSHLGTTGQGIAPCYADKMLRKGIRAGEVLPSEWLWNEHLSGFILAEGAQSVWLDPDLGDYPYVTSSSTLPYNACSLGFPTQKINRVYGVAKMYDTKSGVDPSFPVDLLGDPILGEIAKLGNEFGTTTGRRRIVNYLNLDKLIQAIHLTGTTHLVMNKGDILNKVKESTNLNPYRFLYGGEEAICESLEEMQDELESLIECSLYDNDFQGIYFSDNPETIDWES